MLHSEMLLASELAYMLNGKNLHHKNESEMS